MTPDLTSLLWSLSAPFILGLLILRSLAVTRNSAGPAYLAWVWVAGSLYLALGLMVYQSLGLGPASWWTAPFLLAAIPLAFIVRRVPQSDLPIEPGLSWPVQGFLFLLLGLTLLNVLAAGSLLILETDEARIWAAKAKLMFLTEGFDADFAAGLGQLPHADYPLLNPLLQAWMFSQAGEILHAANRLPVLLFSLALILITASALLRALRPIYAGLLLLVLVDAEVFRVLSQRAYSDLMVATGMVMAFDAGLRWRRSKLPAHAALACMGMALALWSKNDAALFLAAAVSSLIVLCCERRSWAPLPRSLWLALPLGILVLQVAFNGYFDLGNDLLGENPEGGSLLSLIFSQFSERIGPISAYVLDFGLLSPATQGIFLIFGLAIVLLPLSKFRDELYLPTATIGLSLLGALLVYVGSYQELIWHLDTSAGRLLFQLTPFTFVWLALLLRRIAPGLSAG